MTMSSEPDDERFSSERVYLDVPYRDKDFAKRCGARWDPTERQWYAPPGVDLWPLAQWSGLYHPLQGDVTDDEEPYYAWEHCLID